MPPFETALQCGKQSGAACEGISSCTGGRGEPEDVEPGAAQRCEDLQPQTEGSNEPSYAEDETAVEGVMHGFVQPDLFALPFAADHML